MSATPIPEHLLTQTIVSAFSLEMLDRLPEGTVLQIQITKKDFLGLVEECAKRVCPPVIESANETFTDKEARAFFGNISSGTFIDIRKRYGLRNVSPAPKRSLYLRKDCLEILEKVKSRIWTTELV